VHATDATNAGRTLLYNIAENRWDDEMLRSLRHPDGAAARGQRLRRRFRHDRADLFGREIPILGVAGDQQAATIGQACFSRA
jgi:glycerol kinase